MGRREGSWRGEAGEGTGEGREKGGGRGARRSGAGGASLQPARVQEPRDHGSAARNAHGRIAAVARLRRVLASMVTGLRSACSL